MMVRYFFQCVTCQTAVACRTQIGLGKEQVYLFSCPECGVPLGFTLLIDKASVSTKCDALKNLKMFAGEDEPEVLLDFSSDFLVKKATGGARTEEQRTSFLENLSLVTDRQGFLADKESRAKIVYHLWLGLDRARIHYDRNDRGKFLAELSSTGLDQVLRSTNSNSMATMLAESLERYWQLLSPQFNSHRRAVIERISKARELSESNVEQLRQSYGESGRAETVFQEMRNIDRQWADLYSFFAPLEIVEYLRGQESDLAKTYTMSEKPVDRLKAFHSDCFETLGRIFVIAGCYEGIVAGQGIGVPSRKRLIPLEEFELQANGTKPSLLSSLPAWSAFADVFDSKLRNGIGHHSFQFDPSTDKIKYQNHPKTGVVQKFEMPFLDFCIRTRRLYHLLTVAGIYVHSVWIDSVN